MGNNTNGPNGDAQFGARLAVIALLAAAVVLPLLVTAASQEGQAFGMPAVWVYLFVTWVGVIVLAAALVRRSE